MPDIDESIIVVETGQQKLERLGLTQVLTGASVNGGFPVLGVEYPVSSYKVQERLSITQEMPRDAGQGYVFTNLNETEV